MSFFSRPKLTHRLVSSQPRSKFPFQSLRWSPNLGWNAFRDEVLPGGPSACSISKQLLPQGHPLISILHPRVTQNQLIPSLQDSFKVHLFAWVLCCVLSVTGEASSQSRYLNSLSSSALTYKMATIITATPWGWCRD